MKYIVKRPHFGDKDFKVGDIREAKPNEVAHLVKNGILKELPEEVTETKQIKPRSTKAKSE
ncbi:hypothetical protein [Acinetobacter equi]|nr:hypothetical protein [Acinetobacter equi]